ncbi:MAG: InlB B-repeat-containing protein, partial [Clostridia bacterium]|nr:InlB B-repeat-containing protein [Clostridia bacterium]
PTPPVTGVDIDFTNFWDGTGSGSASDNFTFNGSKDLGSLGDISTGGEVTASESEQVSISFNSDGGTAVEKQLIASGEMAIKPFTPAKSGYMFVNWKNGNEVFDFDKPVTKNITLTATWAAVDSAIEEVEGNTESLAVVWAESNTASASVEYSKKGDSAWIKVDNELIRAIDSDSARVDILGLPAGEYEVKINTSTSKSITLPAAVTVSAHDRSGYAHFKYTEGVGAYNDDGSLKDNAIVIYVTDKNKDTVMKDVVAKYSDLKMFKIPNYGGGKDWSNKDADGIGWWLNNSQYTMDNKNSSSNKRPSNTYDQANGSKLGFKSTDRPIVVRFLGTVTTPEGCTAYNSEDEGGSVGDNGNMVRMKNLKNITIEGVGDDAKIDGWGFHFIAGTDAVNGQGKSFEVRNLTFANYTEDAIGMEGQQSGSTITGPVERCWIHNNTFLPGRCDNPAESDKKEGDGSCDFKRGQYYTLSYNYFEYCHKTNLIGSSDSSLQYNITMHHNMWYQCGSRIPLLRQANLHFYNNYVFGDANEKTTPYSHIAKPELSYVHSLRANCYLFSEANYYDGNKNVTDSKTGGAAKSWNDAYYTCFGTNVMKATTTREQQVSNNCSYSGTSYAAFDTDPNLFYYDAENKVTNAKLDDPVTARLRVMKYAGALNFGETNSHVSNSIIKTETKEAVTINETGSTEIALPSTKGTTTVNGVVFTTTGASSGTVKGKGQIATFTITAPAELTVVTPTTGDPAPDLIGENGKVYASGFTGTLIITLPAGTYSISSGQKDKEAVISKIAFADTEASAATRLESARTALAAIPNVITLSDEAIVKEAGVYYSALSSQQKEQLESELYQRYLKAVTALNELNVEMVIARIDYIGTVDSSSYSKINAARLAYASLSAADQTKITNYAKLTAAETAFDGFAVDNVINRLIDLPDLTDIVVKSSTELANAQIWFNAVNSAYEALSSEGQQAQVKAHDGGKTYQKLVDGLKQLDDNENYLDFKELLEETDASEAISAGKALKTQYQLLTEKFIGQLTADEKTKYESIVNTYEEAMKSTVAVTFLDGKPSSEIFVSTGAKQSAKKTKFTINAYGGELATGLKLESSTELTLTLETKMTVSFYMLSSGANTVAVDGVAVDLLEVNGDNVATITLEAGTHKIKRAKSENSLYYVTMVPAA